MKPVIDDLALHAYVDNQLDPESRQKLEQVLAQTPALAHEVERLRQEQRRLRAALAGSASPLFNDPLDPQRIRQALQRRRWRRQAQAAVFLMLLGSATWFGGFSPTSETGLPMDDAVQAYRVFANAETVPDIRFQQATEIPAWLGSRFASPPQLPNFAAQGIKPILGRWLVTEAGPAALVLYQNARGQPLMLYIRPPGQRMKAAGERHDGALVTHYWPDQSYHYALTGLAEAWPR